MSTPSIKKYLKAPHAQHTCATAPTGPYTEPLRASTLGALAVVVLGFYLYQRPVVAKEEAALLKRQQSQRCVHACACVEGGAACTMREGLCIDAMVLKPSTPYSAHMYLQRPSTGGPPARFSGAKATALFGNGRHAHRGAGALLPGARGVRLGARHPRGRLGLVQPAHHRARDRGRSSRGGGGGCKWCGAAAAAPIVAGGDLISWGRKERA
jgi:hypothetical protein